MDKKIFAILGILAVVMIGCAYAAETTTIADVNFTVPDGFTEVAEDAVVNETYSEDDTNYIVNSKTFENDDESILIDILELENNNITDDMVKDFGDEKTINNATGYYVDGGIVKMFTYVQDGKEVLITTVNADDSVIEEVLS